MQRNRTEFLRKKTPQTTTAMLAASLRHWLRHPRISAVLVTSYSVRMLADAALWKNRSVLFCLLAARLRCVTVMVKNWKPAVKRMPGDVCLIGKMPEKLLSGGGGMFGIR